MRLYAYLKSYGGFSKKEVLTLCSQNQVLINGIPSPATTILNESDEVKVNNKIINKTTYRYFIYNKPKGVVCKKDHLLNNSIYQNLELDNCFFTVGRLDKNTEGLIIITNDGVFSHQILSKESHLEKEYEVYLRDPITKDFLNQITSGFMINDKQTIPAKIVSVSDKEINLILFEGQHHQIKRIVGMSNNKVIALKRIRIGNLLLKDLKAGEIKEISDLKTKI